MNKQSTNTIVYDAQTAEHATASVAMEWKLLDDAKRLGGIASKEFRTSFLVGSIAGILRKPLNAGAELLSKKAPLAKDADPEKKKDRRAKVKAGTITERTPAEQNIYVAAGMRLSRFCKAHSIQPANKARGTPKGKGDEVETGKEATPKATSATSADKFMRQQCAMMLAYVEKNRGMLSNSWRDAALELNEAAQAIPTQD